MSHYASSLSTTRRLYTIRRVTLCTSLSAFITERHGQRQVFHIPLRSPAELSPHGATFFHCSPTGRSSSPRDASLCLPVHFPSPDPGRVAVSHRRPQFRCGSRRRGAEPSPRAGDGLAVPAAPGHDLPKQLRAAQDGAHADRQRRCRRESLAKPHGAVRNHQLRGRLRTCETDSV